MGAADTCWRGWELRNAFWLTFPLPQADTCWRGWELGNAFWLTVPLPPGAWYIIPILMIYIIIQYFIFLK